MLKSYPRSGLTVAAKYFASELAEDGVIYLSVPLDDGLRGRLLGLRRQLERDSLPGDYRNHPPGETMEAIIHKLRALKCRGIILNDVQESNSEFVRAILEILKMTGSEGRQCGVLWVASGTLRSSELFEHSQLCGRLVQRIKLPRPSPDEMLEIIARWFPDISQDLVEQAPKKGSREAGTVYSIYSNAGRSMGMLSDFMAHYVSHFPGEQITFDLVEELIGRLRQEYLL